MDNVKVPTLKRRSGAFIIDVVLMLIISFSGELILGLIFRLLGLEIGGINSYILFTVGFILFMGYFPVLERFNSGQTIGRKIAGLRLLQYKGTENKIILDHNNINFVKLIIRNFLKTIWYIQILAIFTFLLPVLFAIAALILIYNDKLHRSFYDKVLKTIVIQT